jgi:hypothetical protein
MQMTPVASEIIARVEDVTGKPVEVIADGSLQVLAKVTMARGGAPRHILRLRLDREVPDYYVAFECGFILRLYECPPAERFQIASSAAGPEDIERMVSRPGGIGPKLRLSAATARQYSGMLADGLITQLRSIPIGMHIDKWIYDTYPTLRTAQSSAINEQMRGNVQVLDAEVKGMSPPKVYKASVGMNAAYALFSDELYGEGGYSVGYRTAGYAGLGGELLDIWKKSSPEATGDKQLVDSWAKHLGIEKWYRWVPLPEGA